VEQLVPLQAAGQWAVDRFQSVMTVQTVCSGPDCKSVGARKSRKNQCFFAGDSAGDEQLDKKKP
jgi:hypothetical protein